MLGRQVSSASSFKTGDQFSDDTFFEFFDSFHFYEGGLSCMESMTLLQTVLMAFNKEV